VVARFATVACMSEDGSGTVKKYFKVREADDDYGACKFSCRPDICVIELLDRCVLKYMWV
jgi:hypothetical protein